MSNVKPPASFVQTIPGSDIFFEMLLVERGTFDMGGSDKEASNWEKPVHPVRLSSFYIGKFPVTQALWKAVMNGENPSFFKGNARPVERVSWEDVTDHFLPKLEAMTGKPFRLLTEAEWEFAARGGNKSGTDSYRYLYSGSNKLKEVGWYNKNSYGETKPVGLKFPNELGIFDMSGNVWEWCSDLTDFLSSAYYEKCKKEGVVLNPPGEEKGDYRASRGGSFFDGPRYCRCSYRFDNPPGRRGSLLGFRLALSPQAAGQPSAFL